jgi:hypothetical protein
VCPKCPHSDPSPDPIRLHVSFGERIDPAAADALWRIVLGGVEADPGGGPSAEGAGTRRTGRHSADAGGIAEAGQDGRA